LAADDALSIRSLVEAQTGKKRWSRFEISPDQIAADRHGVKEAQVRARIKSMQNMMRNK
jgi:hypothetical protein